MEQEQTNKHRWWQRHRGSCNKNNGQGKRGNRGHIQSTYKAGHERHLSRVSRLMCAVIVVGWPCFKVCCKGGVCMHNFDSGGQWIPFCIALAENDCWPNVLFLNGIRRSPRAVLLVIWLLQLRSIMNESRGGAVLCRIFKELFKLPVWQHWLGWFTVRWLHDAVIKKILLFLATFAAHRTISGNPGI